MEINANSRNTYIEDDEITSGKPVSIEVTNPLGCNVKWDGKDGKWMPAEACDLIM